MKKEILKIALLLIDLKGQTTNLEVKNLWHSINPSGNLSQDQVSTYMSELFNESNFVCSRGSKDGFSFLIYKTKETIVATNIAIPVIPPCDGKAVDLVQEAIEAVKKDKSYDVIAVASQIPGSLQNAVVGKLGDLSDQFLKNITPNLYFAYSKKVKPVLFNTLDKFEARKLFKLMTKEKHDDVRMIQVGRYVKKNNL